MSFVKHKVFLLIFLFVSLASFAQTERKGDNYALVIIDMQPKFVTRGGNDQDPENIKKVNQIIENQKQMIALAKKSNIPVIFIEYQNFGDTNTELKEAAKGYDNVKYFEKNTDGFFETSNSNIKAFSDFLHDQQIGNLIITGANGGACVESSIYGSLSNNYNVLAYSKGIADFNYEKFIFPYDDIYDFNPTCPSCKFREIDDYLALELELSVKTNKKKDEEVHDDARTTDKIVPVKTKTKGSNESSQSLQQ